MEKSTSRSRSAVMAIADMATSASPRWRLFSCSAWLCAPRLVSASFTSNRCARAFMRSMLNPVSLPSSSITKGRACPVATRRTRGSEGVGTLAALSNEGARTVQTISRREVACFINRFLAHSAIDSPAILSSTGAGGAVAPAVLAYLDLDGHILAPSYEQQRVKLWTADEAPERPE